MNEQQVVPTRNRFAPIEIKEEKPYDHGFTEKEVLEIEKKFKEIDRRDHKEFPLTIEDQIVVIKHARIKRTEVFILNPVKVKAEKAPRIPKEPKAPKAPKVAKLKKLTKKEQSRLESLDYLLKEEILQLDTMSPDDKLFWELNKHRIEETDVSSTES